MIIVRQKEFGKGIPGALARKFKEGIKKAPHKNVGIFDEGLKIKGLKETLDKARHKNVGIFKKRGPITITSNGRKPFDPQAPLLTYPKEKELIELYV